SRAPDSENRGAGAARGGGTRGPRQPCEAARRRCRVRGVAGRAMFVELHAQSAFSFLEAAEQPETLAQEAARLEMPALALVDRDGVYGAPRFYQAMTRLGLRAIVGSELTLRDGSRLPLLVEEREGYQNLCRLITKAKLSGAPATLDDVEEHARGLVCLT